MCFRVKENLKHAQKIFEGTYETFHNNIQNRNTTIFLKTIYLCGLYNMESKTKVKGTTQNIPSGGTGREYSSRGTFV